MAKAILSAVSPLSDVACGFAPIAQSVRPPVHGDGRAAASACEPLVFKVRTVIEKGDDVMPSAGDSGSERCRVTPGGTMFGSTYDV